MLKNRNLKRIAIILNVIFVISFIYANIVIGGILAGNNEVKSNIVTITWNPLSIHVVYHSVVNGELVTTMGFFTYPNGPFIIFLISVVVNIVLFVLMKSEGKVSIKEKG